MRFRLCRQVFFLQTFLVFFVFKLKAQSSYSESIVPPSPVAGALARVGEANVNLYRGTPNISIPLFSLKTRTLSQIASLEYIGGAGIKVQEISSTAGLGWVFSTGGVITRTVRGYPDEDSRYGYCMSNKAGLQADPSSTTFINSLSSLVEDNDLEPDVFSCSLGGRIVFSYDKQPVFTNDQGLLIKKNGLFSSDSTWEIVDKKGVRYLFGKSANEREHTIAPVGPYSETLNFVSSWHLSEIISPDGEVLRFTYMKGDVFVATYVSQSKITTYYSLLQTKVVEMQVWDPKYVQQIIATNGKATITYADRWDNAGQKFVDKILVTDAKGALSTAFRFKIGYFSDGGTDQYARPKLLAVEQMDTAQKKYIRVAGLNYYEQELLPARNSIQYDHWGYYNNNTTGKRFLSEGAVRTSDLNKCKANILTSIDWPNGGRTEYEYELNVYRKYNVDHQGGGLRIKNVRQIEAGKILQRSYSYLKTDNTSSGLLQSRFNPDSGYISKSTYHYPINTGVSIINVDGTVEVETDLPIFQLFDINGVGVGYSRVETSNPDLSKVVEIYQDYNEFPNQELGVFLAGRWSYSANITSSYTPALYGIFNFYTPAVQQRGLLKERQLLNATGAVVQKFIYKYTLANKTAAPVVRGFQKRLYSTVTPDGQGSYNTFIGTAYQEYVTLPQLVSEETYTYSQGTPSLAVKTFKRNEYKNNYPYLISKTTESSSDGDSLIATYTYPYEVQVSGQPGNAANLMTTLNIVEPLELVGRIKRAGVETVTNAIIKLYSPSGATVRPSKTNLLEAYAPISDYQSIGSGMTFDARCKTNFTFDLYALSGELLQFNENNGAPTALIWGNKRQSVVAKVKGATYNVAAQYVDTALLNSGTLSDAAMRSELNKIRANVTTAEVNTYTYTPLGVMTSATDAAGRSTYYIYDAFSKLRTVKDLNGNIQTQYDYYVNTAGGWEDTQTKRCLTDASGQYTGEEQVQEIDKNPSSATYNQTRWRSLGFTNSCNTTIYVRLAIQNGYTTTWEEPGPVMWALDYADVVAYFYQDPACRIPRSVSNLNVTFNVSPTSGGPRHPGYVTKTVLCNGKSTILVRAGIQRESTVDFPPAEYLYKYTPVSGPGYIAK